MNKLCYLCIVRKYILIMASYKRMKLVDLQNVCEERGLTCHGLTKRALIELLIDADEQEHAARVASDVDDDVENGQDGIPSDEEITFGPQPARRGADVAASTAALDRPGEGSESLEILRLKLRLAKEEKEKERERQRKREREEREIERERERAERAREDRECEWAIEQQRAELGLHPAQNGNGTGATIAKHDLSHVLPRMSEADVLVFFQFL